MGSLQWHRCWLMPRAISKLRHAASHMQLAPPRHLLELRPSCVTFAYKRIVPGGLAHCLVTVLIIVSIVRAEYRLKDWSVTGLEGPGPRNSRERHVRPWSVG